MNYKPGICTFCGTGCGHLLKVTNDQIDGVFPSQNHPVSKGRLCVRGWNIHELLSTRARITTPLIKKNDKFEKATYDEAISYLIEKLLEYSDSTAKELGFLASPRSSNEENYLFMKLARAVFKNNNISLISDTGHRNSLNVLEKGTGMAGMLGSLEEISKCEFILVYGMDITELNPIIGSEIHLAAKRGAKLVTIDRRKTEIAELSDKFLFVRPASGKLALSAFAKVLLEENLIDKDYLEKFTEGHNEYIELVNSLDYKDIISKTGCDIDDLKEIAREFGKAKSGMAFFPSGISGFDKDTISHIFNLFLLSGKIGREGCGVNPLTGINNLQGSCDMGIAPDLLTGFQRLNDNEVLTKFSKYWKTELNPILGIPVYDMLYENIRGFSKAIVLVDFDEGVARGAHQMEKVEFIAYIGTFENEVTQLANVVLPTASYVECDGTFTNAERRVQLTEKKMEPKYDVLPAWKLYAKIAEKSGMKWNYESPSDIMKEIADLTPSYSGISYDKLRNSYGIQWPCDNDHPDGTRRIDIENSKSKYKFATLTGKFKTPSGNEDFPYLLIIGRALDYWQKNNIMKHTFIPLREYNATLLLFPEGYIEISSEDAKELQVRDYSPVRVKSPYGVMETKVMVSDRVKPDTVYVPYFVQKMITEFLFQHREIMHYRELDVIPVRIIKV